MRGGEEYSQLSSLLYLISSFELTTSSDSWQWALKDSDAVFSVKDVRCAVNSCILQVA